MSELINRESISPHQRYTRIAEEGEVVIPSLDSWEWTAKQKRPEVAVRPCVYVWACDIVCACEWELGQRASPSRAPILIQRGPQANTLASLMGEPEAINTRGQGTPRIPRV